MSLPTMIAAHPQVEDETEELVTAARLAVRRTAQNIDVLRAQLEACITACETCAAECESHDNPHCSLCAKMCRECAEDCRKALPLVK